MTRRRSGLPSRVAVIGTGFIGTHVAAALLAEGVEVVVVNRSPLDDRKQKLLSGAEIAVVDASVRELLRPQLRGVDHVVYCASGLMPAESNLDPVVDVGLSLPPLLNTLQLLSEAPQQAGFTYLSSGGTVYGTARSDPIDERHPTEPVTSYGIMKLTGERYALMHRHMTGLPLRILRCANVYGEYQPASRSQGAVAVFVDRIAAGVPIPLFGDGTIVRDFVYVGDVAEVILRGMARLPTGPTILNVGSGAGHSLSELVHVIEAVLDQEARIDARPARAYDVPRIVLDIGLARRELGFEPTELELGIRRTVAATDASGTGRT